MSDPHSTTSTLARLRRLGPVSPRARRIVGAVAGLALGALGLAFAARGVDAGGLASALTGVHGWWLAAAALANVGTITAQGFAWRVGIEAGGMGRIHARHAIAATWVGKAGNQLLPGKVGEIARIAMIRTHIDPDRREISRVVGSVAAQRVVNIAAMFLVVTFAASIVDMPVQPPGGKWALLAASVLATLAVVSAAALRRRRGAGLPGGGRVRATLRRFAAGAGVLQPNAAGAKTLGFHLLGVACQVAMMGCLLRAFEVSAGVSAPLFVIVLFGLAGAVPGAPGGAGLNQAALVAPLGAVYGVAPDTALAFSLGLQSTLALVAVAGGILAVLHHRMTHPARTAIP